MYDTAIIIPVLEPDERFIKLVEQLAKAGFQNMIVVDDGSGPSYRPFFLDAKEKGCTVLTHVVNQGKGRALKTAFLYLLEEQPECLGAITVDSDGQHRVEDVRACAAALVEHPGELILGCRDFHSQGIPWKSRFGNRLTCRMLRWLCDVSVSDTQTGLRGFSPELMRIFLQTKGERFEWETNMLLETKEKGIDIYEVPIHTIYIEGNQTSHFHPLWDSVQIYGIFFKFILTSFSSSILDILLFTLLISFLQGLLPDTYILVSTAVARMFSAAYNYTLNRRKVFREQDNGCRSAVKYLILSAVVLAISAYSVNSLHFLFHLNESLTKIVVDVLLFLFSFKMQQIWVFKNRKDQA